MSTSQLAFDPDLISKAAQSELGSEFVIRPLARDDHKRGHLDVLAILTVVPDPGEKAWQERFDLLKSFPDTYFPIVIVRKDTDRIVAVGTIIIEHKFLRNLGSIGHIEDIATAKEAQGKGLGKRVIQALTHISEVKGAYKTLLDCNKDNIPFYEKCGYQHKEYQMVKYVASAAKS